MQPVHNSNVRSVKMNSNMSDYENVQKGPSKYQSAATKVPQVATKVPQVATKVPQVLTKVPQVNQSKV
jgi:hypothetical protein